MGIVQVGLRVVGPVHEFAEHLRLGHHHAVDGGGAVHLGDGGLAIAQFHLDAELIARPHRLAELGLLHRGEEHELGLAAEMEFSTSTPATWAIASTINTLGMTGKSGKWPEKNGSLTVTFLMPTIRSSSSSSMRSTSSIG